MRTTAQSTSGRRIEHVAHVVELDRDQVDGGERAGVGRAHAAVEHRHLAEQRARSEHREHRLAVVGRLGHDRDPAREHDVQVRRGLALLEDRVAAAVARERGPASQLLEQLGRQCAEEIGLVEHRRACRHVAASCPRGRLSEPARGRPVCSRSHCTSAETRPRPESFRRGVRSSRPADPPMRASMFVEGVRLFVVVLGTAAGFWAARTFGTEAQGLGGMLGLPARLRQRRDPRPGARSRPRRRRAPGRPPFAGPVRGRHARRHRRRRARPRAGAPGRAPRAGARSRCRWSAWPRGSSAASASGSSPARARRCSSCSGCRRVRWCGRRRSTPATDCSSTPRSSWTASCSRSPAPACSSGDLMVARFVLDEVQGFADATDDVKRRRARRGLEILDALRHEGERAPVHPRRRGARDPRGRRQAHRARARRLQLRLLTNDGPLARNAELQGVPTTNLRKLAQELTPSIGPGDFVRVSLTREGKERARASAISTTARWSS